MSFVANGLLKTLPSTPPSLAEAPSFASNGLLEIANPKLHFPPGPGDNSKDATQRCELLYLSSIRQVKQQYE
jgi:hypothetical protein